MSIHIVNFVNVCKALVEAYFSIWMIKNDF